jgi:hypothetical protein
LREIPYGKDHDLLSESRRRDREQRQSHPDRDPCHRVIGSNGSMIGFGGGIDVKRRLLALEAGGGTTHF